MATILIVDDEVMIQQMVAAVVEDMGHRALTAGDGQSALTILDATQRPPALVISDLMMPHVNGIELAQAIKANPRLHDTPIVLMSAACHSRCADPADMFLAKPFELHEIERFVEQYLGSEATAAPGAAD